jgi:hypothetical protein
MTSFNIPASVQRLIRRRAKNRCEYCQTSESLSGIACEIDHIIPRAHNGPTTAENLCLACVSCNGHKQAKTHAIDPKTGTETPLFHPRRQRWRDHFAWSEDGSTIVGITACGRATIDALMLNSPLIVVARSMWVSSGQHPPKN